MPASFIPMPHGATSQIIGRLPPSVRGYATRSWQKTAAVPSKDTGRISERYAASYQKADAWLQSFAKPFFDSPLPFDLGCNDVELKDAANKFAEQYRVLIEQYSEAAAVMALVRPLRASVLSEHGVEVAAFVRQTALSEAALFARKAGVPDEALIDVYERGVHGALLKKIRAAGFDAGEMFAQPKENMTADELAEMREVHLKKMADKYFWRRWFRRLQNRGIENIYRRIGFVHARGQLYVSDDNIRRHRQRRAQNRALMSAVTLINELGQEYSLDELSALSISNPEIRRAELMTRISGFEHIARDLNHAGEFITITCPSRFHSRHHKSGQANDKFDGSTPVAAAKYLSAVWARIRATLAREEIAIYGFRVAEPHHDGTPHWHGLLFMQKQHVKRFRQVVAQQACADSRRELGLFYQDTAKAAGEKRRGDWKKAVDYAKACGMAAPKLKDMAQKRSHNHAAAFWKQAEAAEFAGVNSRVDFTAINWNKGTAAGYIAKYIAKNIDGKTAVGESAGPDLETEDLRDMTETAERVGCWASVHGIRQFQQIGGPPVTVWRELRRLDRAETEDYQDDITRATIAADSGDWGKFVMVMGGIAIKRKDRPVQLYKEDTDIPTKYGEARPPLLRGVYEKDTGQYKITRIHEWEVKFKGGEAAPWTCVNNCTKKIFDAENAQPVGISAKKPVIQNPALADQFGLITQGIAPQYRAADFSDEIARQAIVKRFALAGGDLSDFDAIEKRTTAVQIATEKEFQAAWHNIRPLITDDMARASLAQGDEAFTEEIRHHLIEHEKDSLAGILAVSLTQAQADGLVRNQLANIEADLPRQRLVEYLRQLNAITPAIAGGKGVGIVPADPVFNFADINQRKQTRLPLPSKGKTTAQLLAEAKASVAAVDEWLAEMAEQDF